jgi:peptide-methionine (S)-S-oxide reductase
MLKLKKVGFGGGCHWCTEAYFQSLLGVEKVEQGWINSFAPNDAFSEAVIVHYNSAVIPLEILVTVHLHTHSSTKDHSFRQKYRSAVYVFDGKIEESQSLIAQCQVDFNEPIITQVLLFLNFKLNIEQQQNYYLKNKEGIFCQRYISPKLERLKVDYPSYFKEI